MVMYSNAIIIQIAKKLMATRPVLAMNFYWSQTGNLINAYDQMQKRAQQQKVTQQITKKEIIKQAIHSIEEIVDNFIPQSKTQPVRQVRKNSSGPYKYDPSYFQKLDSNIRLINGYLDTLEHQIPFNKD